MNDDEMMARFFASYVPPSERPTIAPIPMAETETRAVAALNAVLRGDLEDAVDPVLPEGWTWIPKQWPYVAHAQGPSGAWIGIDDSLHVRGLEPMRRGLCKPGQFPEVERYVLWKNGVVK